MKNPFSITGVGAASLVLVLSACSSQEEMAPKAAPAPAPAAKAEAKAPTEKAEAKAPAEKSAEKAKATKLAGASGHGKELHDPRHEGRQARDTRFRS